jgi:hypothetical protein
MFDFFSCAQEQDKQQFKGFIEDHTRFKYVDNIYFLDLSVSYSDAKFEIFTQAVNNSKETKQGFLAVKRLNNLLSKFDHKRKNDAAKKVNNFKRCVFNIEDNYRQTFI